jgi:hypothetical protein
MKRNLGRPSLQKANRQLQKEESSDLQALEQPIALEIRIFFIHFPKKRKGGLGARAFTLRMRTRTTTAANAESHSPPYYPHDTTTETQPRYAEVRRLLPRWKKNQKTKTKKPPP